MRMSMTPNLLEQELILTFAIEFIPAGRRIQKFFGLDVVLDHQNLARAVDD